MSWRKWLVRTVVFSIAGGLASAGFLYERWTNPAAIREQALASPSRPGVEIKVSQAIVINDPLPQVRYSVRGTSELTGVLKIDGHLQRPSNALSLKAEAGEIPLNAALIHTLAAYVPK